MTKRIKDVISKKDNMLIACPYWYKKSSVYGIAT
jgi:hypothetical protein